MELVAVLRMLWRRRLAVGAAAFVALFAGWAAGGGVAVGPFAPTAKRVSASLLVQLDTPKPLLAYVRADDSEGGGAIGIQAQLFAEQMARADVKAEIVRRAGLPSDQLGVLTNRFPLPARVTPLAVKATEIAESAGTPYVLRATASEELPLIHIEASGADRATVERLVRAPAAVLASRTATGARDATRQFKITALEPAAFATTASTGRGGPLVGAVVFFLLFIAGCTAIVLLSGMRRALNGGVAATAR